jgi:hypothetical protein
MSWVLPEFPSRDRDRENDFSQTKAWWETKLVLLGLHYKAFFNFVSKCVDSNKNQS